MINKIKINNQLWISFRHNKWILGGIDFPPDIHLTLHLGGHSGKIDLHFKNEKTNKYFTILRLLKNEVEEITEILIQNVILILRGKVKILSHKDFKKKYHIIDYSILEKKIQNQNIEYFLNYLNIKEKKRTLNIATSLDNLRIPYDYIRMIKNHIIQNRRRLDINELTGGSAIHKRGGSFSYIVLEKKICLFDSHLVENFDKILIQSIGIDLFNQIMDRFQIGINNLNPEKSQEDTGTPIEIRIIRNVKNEASA